MSQPKAHGPRITRRGLIKTVGAAGTAAVAPTALQGSGADPVGGADALPCGGLCVGAAAVGAAAAIGWALREFEVIGADDPPSGLTPSALKQQLTDVSRTRQSVNRSTFVDNKNILDGAKHVAYGDGKLAAIKSLNNQDTQSTVETAATDAVDAYETTLKKNLLSSWNESVNELSNLVTRVTEHSDVAASTIQYMGESSTWTWVNVTSDLISTRDVVLPDDTTLTVQQAPHQSTGYDPAKSINRSPYQEGEPFIKIEGSEQINYLRYPEWREIYSKIESICNTVRDGLLLWVDKVYSKVQSGEIETADLLTPRELAQLTSSEEETLNQAVADLMALNIPVNLDREAQIKLSSSGTTLYGSLGVTGEKTLTAGTTIDPSTDSNSYYLTYDVSEAHGTWESYQEAVDGGVVTFTSEPHPSMTYALETGAQEAATVKTSDFTDNGDGTWSVDISGQVETAITTLTSVEFYSESDETQMETVRLDEQFEIVEFTDSEGNTVDSANYSKPTQPETDSNYITQEEWEQREQKYKEQIDKYEQQANTGGGGGVSVGDFSADSMVGGAVALVLAIVGIAQATK